MKLLSEMGLSPEIVKAISEIGFVSPTPIQEKTIPYLLESDKDIVALAQTGTGKTAAFGLPIVQLVETDKNYIQALILCPTRELCLQIGRDLDSFSKYTQNLKVAAVYGGADIRKQIKDLDNGAQIVVGTPGRVMDLINRKKLKVGNVRWMVLDEADEMLSMGFKDELDAILEGTPEEKQTLLFSATMPREIASIAKKYMNKPEEISVGQKNTASDNVQHQYFLIHARDRYEALKRIADINPDIYSIVFTRTRLEAQEIADKLIQDGYNADSLHGDLSQAQRDLVMGRFRTKALQILVATDVAARGIDVTELTHVINYNLPDDPEVYIHRSGRTGRAGKKGISISLINMREKSRIHFIEKLTNKKFELKPVPTVTDICEKQLLHFIERVEHKEADNPYIDKFLPIIYAKLSYLTPEQLIKQFVSVEFDLLLKYYKDAKDINVTASDRRDRDSGRDRDSRRDDRGDRRRDDREPRWESKGQGNYTFSRFFINIGRRDDINKRSIIDLINQAIPGTNAEIGKIEVLGNFSFFELDKNFEKDVLKGFKHTSFKGRKVEVEISKEKENERKKTRY